MPPRVSTGDWDAVLRQIRWCATVQTLVNCRCQLEDNPVGNVEPMQLVVQYLTQAAIKLPSSGDNTRMAFSTQSTLVTIPTRFTVFPFATEYVCMYVCMWEIGYEKCAF